MNINENKINLLKDQLNNLKEDYNIIKNNKKINSQKYNDDINESNTGSNINKKLLNENNINTNNIDFDPKKLKIKIIKGQVKTDEVNKPYLDYVININYDGIKNWQIHKKLYHFANLYHTLNNSYTKFAQFPNSFTNIFEDLNSKSSLNLNKIQQLEKFINEVAHTDVINKSKPFLKFIELEQNMNKKWNNKNRISSSDTTKNNYFNNYTNYNKKSKKKQNNYSNNNSNSNFLLYKDSDYTNYSKYNNNVTQKEDDNYSKFNNRYTNSYFINDDEGKYYYNNIIINDKEEDDDEFEEQDEEGVIKSSYMNDLDLDYNL